MSGDMPPTIAALMAAVMGDVQAVGKSGRNTQQGYNFRGVDAVVNAVGPVLRKHGVVPMPHKTVAQYRDVQTSTGKPSRECTVTVTYRFYGPAGDFLEAEVPGESMDVGDKGAPKAMSVAYRILLLQALCIPTDEPEPDAQSYERGQTPMADQPRHPSVIRAEIGAFCKAHRRDLAEVARAFEDNFGEPIAEAGSDHLEQYLAALRNEVAA